jgi:hypothetical protein
MRSEEIQLKGADLCGSVRHREPMVFQMVVRMHQRRLRCTTTKLAKYIHENGIDDYPR